MNWEDLNNNNNNNNFHWFEKPNKRIDIRTKEEDKEEEHISKQINKKLDEIISIRAEIKRMDAEIADDQVLNNLETGAKTNKEEAMGVVEDMLNRIKEELNRITNNGKNIKDIFTNNYYVNDMMQDKECAGDEGIL